MGCAESKEKKGSGSAEKYTTSYDSGMGTVAVSWDKVMKSRSSKISVMTGHWEVQPDQLDPEYQESLGESKFGLVYEGRIRGLGKLPSERANDKDWSVVVIKKLAADPTKAQHVAFLKEIQYMKEIEHDNILRLVGVCTQEPPLMMIFESCAGGILKNYLAARRASQAVSSYRMCAFGSDVASGLAYLAGEGVVHGDVATRNCMVTNNLVAKVGDFGLSRSKFANEYVEYNGETVPVRWMAPELLLKKAEGSTETDVWAFGVLLWEIVSFGNQPYPSLTNNEIIDHVKKGGSMDAPKSAPGGMYDIMKACWSTDAKARPQFADLAQKLAKLGDSAEKDETDAAGVLVDATRMSRTASSSAVITTQPTIPTPEKKNPSPEKKKSVTVVDPNYADPQDGSGNYALANIPEAGPEGALTSSVAAHPSNTPSSEVTGEAYVDPSEIRAIKQNSKTDLLMQAKKSYRSLQAFKEAEKPEDALEQLVGGKKNLTYLHMSDITVLEDLGKGAFGLVQKGRLVMRDGATVDCALKTLKPGSLEDDKDALFAEAYLVSQFDHPNVIACFGAVNQGESAMIVFEFMANGSLYQYLQDSEDDFSLQVRMRMAIDVARGMQYLANKNHVHRDLATRNILVGENLVCKISDFGLSRDLEDDQYYESDGGMVPIRWTPPEAYKYKKYSSASDVWSFGILLYEIWTNAALPYGKEWSNLNVMMEVERGYRLPPPKGCPRAVYQLMLDSWNPARKSRPSFDRIVDKLEMAYDMLFQADTGKPIETDFNYGNMAQVYLGVPVPTAENLDMVYEPAYLEPTPLAAQGLAGGAAQKAELEAPYQMARKTSDIPLDALSGSSSDSTPGTNRASVVEPDKRRDMFQYGADGRTAELRRQTNSAPSKPSPELSARIATTIGSQPVDGPAGRRGSLRKQKVAAEESKDSETVQYISTMSVAEVLRIAQEKEKLSTAETVGLVLAEKKLGVQVTEKPEYIENVGRAKEAEAVTHIAGRKKCVCRRFKCVCNLEG